MRYALLIYTEPTEPAPEEFEATMAAYNAFTKEAADAGVMRGGEALEDAKEARTVRVRDGQTLVTDGPFAETKEEFGGYYIVDAPSIDEAIRWAAKIPGAKRGSIEVRPVWDIPDSGLGAAAAGVGAAVSAG